MAQQILTWAIRNKLILFLSVLSFCLFVSTITLAAQKNKNDRITQVLENGDLRKILEPSNKEKLNYRLPRNVLPTSYDLKLVPDLVAKLIYGEVKINITVLEPTNRITLHTHLLKINNVSLRQQNDNITIKSFEVVTDDREFMYVDLEDTIFQGVYQLAIHYKGRLDHGFVGIYSSTLKSGNHTMVSSKFQPTYARQAFPCFDEPDFKATFDITLVKPKSYIALSNMNDISTVADPKTDTEAVTFATSVPMSTYLACFVICDFAAKETTINSNGIGKDFTLRSFAQKDQTHKIDFAQDIGKRATEFYIDYYQVPFPLPKLDMIAIPDYVSGATEHWGLITYRETSFLIDEATASATNKISVANTIAHELAHMWFGNLVTMKWWDEVWLNEGFASYMQVKSLNAIEPSWTMLDQFLTRTMHSVLNTDSKLSSHPIVQTVTTPDQITSIFDAISYNKGSSVLRMLEGFVGEENFRNGVTDYLKRHEFGNTITQNLLDSLEPYFRKDNPQLDITYIMDTWTKQKGYPVLEVTHNEESNKFIVSQKRFLLDPEAVYNKNTQFKYRWYIPITYKTNNGVNNSIQWFPDNDKKVTIKVDSKVNWLKINNNQVGYYRVNYPNSMWSNLITALKSKSDQLTISDRAHLLDDVFALAEGRQLSYNTAFNLTTYLTLEDQLVPWTTASNIFNDLSLKLMNSLAYTDLLKYVQHLIEPLYLKQKWTAPSDISVINSLLRVKILSMAAEYELPDAVSNARTLFLHWLNNYGTSTAIDIEPDLRSLIYYYGMKNANKEEWDKFWNIYLKEEDAQEQAKIRKALAAPREPTILRRYLSLAWDESNIRGQDYLNVLSHISNNPSGTCIVWDDVRARWPQLVDRFTLNSRYLGNLIPSITDTFDTEFKLKEMESFFEAYPEAGAGEPGRSRALETVQTNIKWTVHNENTVREWLAKYISNRS